MNFLGGEYLRTALCPPDGDTIKFTKKQVRGEEVVGWKEDRWLASSTETFRALPKIRLLL